MKRILLTLVVSLIAANSFAQISLYYTLYQKKDFPGLTKQLNLKGEPASAAKQIFEAAIHSAYGRSDKAYQILEKAKDAGVLNDTLEYVALTTRLEIAAQQSDYKAAARAATRRLNRFRSWIPEEKYKEEQEAMRIYSFSMNVPPQSLNKSADTRLELKKDLAGLMNVPVELQDSTFNFVFDSGAGMSVISERYALDLKLKFVSDSTVEIKSGSTGVATTSRVAVAEKIRIGNMEVNNVLFLVFPDSALSFAGGRYIMKGIIGFPVIAAMGEITLSGQELYIPETIKKSKATGNMILHDYMPVIYLKYRGVELPFTFDTGANTSSLSHNFYHRFQTDFADKGIARTQELHGVGGGSKKFEGIEMPNIQLQSAGSMLQLNNVFIMKEPFDANGEIFYGNIGKDVIKGFKSITISFANGNILFNN
ncbi:MAG TPA: retropepsin-like aspartic protease [Sphingobacteriaceae bacterium]